MDKLEDVKKIEESTIQCSQIQKDMGGGLTPYVMVSDFPIGGDAHPP